VGFDTKAWQVFLEQARGGAEYRARANDMITHLKDRQAQTGDRCHTGGSRNTALPSLHGSQFFFEGPRSGIGKARIDIARFRSGKSRGGLGGIFKNEARRCENRFAVFHLGSTPMPAAYSDGIKTGIVVCHGVSPI
jgi:hypothetical protein